MDADLEHDALGTRPDGTPVLLADIWPSDEEIAALVAQHVDCSLYEEGTRGLYDGDAAWAALGSEPSDTFSWDDASTYVRRAPYFDGMEREPSAPKPVEPLARWRCWATSSPPTTSRRRVPLPPTRPRPATWRSAAWLRPTSTPTARAAATTR